MKNGKYEFSLAPDDYPGKRYRGRYVYEHHLVWWRKVGFLVPKGFEIHHVNGDPRDNQIDNLALLSAKAHRALHARERRRTMKALNCSHCGNIFEREVRNYRFRSKAGQKNFYCSRRCMGYGLAKKRKNIAA